MVIQLKIERRLEMISAYIGFQMVPKKASLLESQSKVTARFQNAPEAKLTLEPPLSIYSYSSSPPNSIMSPVFISASAEAKFFSVAVETDDEKRSNSS